MSKAETAYYALTDHEQTQAERMADDVWDDRARVYYETIRAGETATGYCKTKSEAENAGKIAQNIRRSIYFLITGQSINLDYDRIKQAVKDMEESEAKQHDNE